MSRGRSKKMITRRGSVLVARYYYWTVIWERNYDRVLEAMANDEFFIEPATIQRHLSKPANDEFMKQLMKERPDVKQLSEMFPVWRWVAPQFNTTTKNK